MCIYKRNKHGKLEPRPSAMSEKNSSQHPASTAPPPATTSAEKQKKTDEPKAAAGISRKSLHMLTAREGKPEAPMSSTQCTNKRERPKPRDDNLTKDLLNKAWTAGVPEEVELDTLEGVAEEMPDYCADKERHFEKKIAAIKESDKLRRELLYGDYNEQRTKASSVAKGK